MSCENKCPLKTSRHNDAYTLGYCDGHQQGRIDRDKELLKEIDYLLNCGMGKKKTLVHLRGMLVKEQKND